jgi:hypothetical protein
MHGGAFSFAFNTCLSLGIPCRYSILALVSPGYSNGILITRKEHGMDILFAQNTVNPETNAISQGIKLLVDIETPVEEELSFDRVLKLKMAKFGELQLANTDYRVSRERITSTGRKQIFYRPIQELQPVSI